MFRNPTTDLIVVLVIVLLIFGPKRLPGLGKSLGPGLREFKDSITGESIPTTTSRAAPGDRPHRAPPVAGTGEPTVTVEPTPASAPPARDPAERSS